MIWIAFLLVAALVLGLLWAKMIDREKRNRRIWRMRP